MLSKKTAIIGGIANGKGGMPGWVCHCAHSRL
jgi:hypothetical protein